MRILFVTSTRLGDAVLSTGLLDHLRRTHPGARVTIACGPVAAGLFDRMPGRDATWVVEKRAFDWHWPALWARAARHRWDLAVDLRGSALTFLLAVRRRAVMRGGRRPGHRLLHLAGVLRLDPPPLPTVWTDAADRAEAARLLPGTEVLGICPTANWAGKIWPAERFLEAAARLVPGGRVAVFGGPGPAERAHAAPVLAALPDAIDLVGRLPLPAVAACLARCRLVLANDSGLMHLAAAAGAPTLGLFGPTSAAEYAPSGRRAAAVLSADGTMGGLAVSAAIEAAAALLRRSQAAEQGA